MTAGRFTLLTTVLLIFSLSFSVAQQKSKAQLQKEKQKNLDKIKQVEKILNETTAKKKNSLGELNALKQRIREQENLITSIRNEISFLDTEIKENQGFITALEEDLKKLKEEYTAMLFAAQKANNSATRLTFLFSAASFDQLVMRLRYMEQYSERRKLQAEAITKVQDELSGQVKQIEATKTEKNNLLEEELSENNRLGDLRKKQNTLVRSLEKEEKSLRKDLDETKKAVAKLDRLINEIIREEMERTAREAKAKGTSSANLALSASFAENKNKFPWPVPGFISQTFGRQKHPTIKGVEIDNQGINIQTAEGAKVKAIFQGEVSRIAYFQVLGNSVIINHGEYFTVYSGLKEVYVKTGQQVTSNQEIGQVLSNHDGISELRFQIRKQFTALDPQQWLRN